VANFADLGGGAGGSPGGNTLSCNTSADLVYNDFGTLFAQNNRWDHVPPTEGLTASGGIDVVFTEAFVDTSGAALVAFSCNTTSTVTITLIPSGSIGSVNLTIDYDETLVAFSSATASGVAAGAIVSSNDGTGNCLPGNLCVGLVADPTSQPNGFPVGQILTVTFRNVAGGLPTEASYPITSLAVFDLSGAPITGVSSSLTVTNR
jgi:hypothetical protein